MEFEFTTAGRIVFGPDALQRMIPEIVRLTHRPLVVTGSNPLRAEPLVLPLESRGVPITRFKVTGEPTLEVVAEGTQIAREAGCDGVIGIGGGSVIDTGKAIAAMMTNPGEVLDYLEGIGSGKVLSEVSAPFIAIPTTAGTGSEVTRNAVLKSEAHGVKVSLRSPWLHPILAVVDPVLTRSMPPEVTASTGMDALTQLIEPFLSNAANPLTDSLCREGIKRVRQALERAYRDGSDASAREEMALASLFSGLALANSRLGAVHGIAGPLGGISRAPHGVICARLLPLVMRTNLTALRTRRPDPDILARFDEVAQLLTGNPHARADEGIDWIERLNTTLQIPPLSAFGAIDPDFETLIPRIQTASSMKGNPIPLEEAEIRTILLAVLGNGPGPSSRLSS